VPPRPHPPRQSRPRPGPRQSRPRPGPRQSRPRPGPGQRHRPRNRNDVKLSRLLPDTFTSRRPQPA